MVSYLMKVLRFTRKFTSKIGWLVGLSDLNTEKPYVQERIATYFATLLSVGRLYTLVTVGSRLTNVFFQRIQWIPY
jgi:hypothetical protein